MTYTSFVVASLFMVGVAAFGGMTVTERTSFPVPTRVTFQVEGVEVVGHMYMPTSGQGPFPAILTAGSMTSLKEMNAGNYARRLAAEGFVTLAIDHRHFGESGGEPRQFEHKERKIEDLEVALNFLLAQPQVDPERVGGLGICAGAAYLSGALGGDLRVKAIGYVAGAFTDATIMKGILGDEEYQRRLDLGIEAREEYEATGKSTVIAAWGLPDSTEPAYYKGDDLSIYDYYEDPTRGAVPGYINGWNLMSYEPHATLDAQQYADLHWQPVAMVHSTNAIAPPFAEAFFARLPVTDKSITWLDSPDHTSFYDMPAQVNPSMVLMLEHFRKHL
jgi:dienelactone hydrolase